MNRPILALGRAGERQLSQAAFAPCNRIYTENAASFFAPGDLIFIAEADGAGLEFLGAAASVASDYLTATLWLRADKTAAAKVWRPAASFVLPCAPAFPLKREFASGIQTVRSAGGALFSVRVAEPSRVDRLQFDRMRWADFLAMRAWIDAHLQGGLLDFSYVDERGAAWRARLNQPDFAVAQDDEQLASFELQIAALEQGAFV